MIYEYCGPEGTNPTFGQLYTGKKLENIPPEILKEWTDKKWIKKPDSKVPVKNKLSNEESI